MLKRKNVLTKFREFWKKLDTPEQRELWDVLTALRGDDVELSLKLKLFVTARIRGELLRQRAVKVLPMGAYMCPTRKDALAEFNQPSLSNFKEHFKKASEHWQTHVRKAIRVIIKYHPSRARDLKKFGEMERR